jgi:exoribonuclease II
LRWLEQNGVTELEASVMKDGLVRAETLPLVFRATGTENLPRGSRVRVRLTGTDLLTLDLHAQLLARIEEPASGADPVAEPEGEDELEGAGTLTLAIDLEESPEATKDVAAPTAG